MSIYLSITIRAIVSYLILFILTRLMGKREISQMTYFDYIVGITIGSMAAIMAIDKSTTILITLPGLMIFALFQIVISYTALKNKSFRKLSDGDPTFLIKNGKVMEKNLLKERLNIDELTSKLREKNAFNIADVEFALLEPDGQISVMFKTDKQSVTPSDLNIQTKYMGFSNIVIEEGRIISSRLREKGLTQSWLMSKIAEQGVYDLSSIMFAQVDESGNLYIDLYEDGKNDIIKQNRSDEITLAKLEKLHSDFCTYSTEIDDNAAKILYKECEEKLDRMTNTFKNYIDKKSKIYKRKM
ncbi:MAG: DUF421 domain-containing protein [Clostridium sp.]|nr:DUF421 domain-containing protein [Clostridium sp.]